MNMLQTLKKFKTLFNMTKKEFITMCAQLSCSAHYQGHTKTMFVFGSNKNLKYVSGGSEVKSGKRYYANGIIDFGVIMQATS